MVTTVDPLFTKADEADAPKLKPGVWAGPKSADCAFDERAAVDTWPACANGAIIGQGTLGGYDKIRRQRPRQDRLHPRRRRA